MQRYESWIERQIREAQERGDFDNLPGAGKPIEGLNDPDENWWIKGLLKREQIGPVLPTSLLLRKQVETLQDTVAEERDEETVRAIVADLNARIRDSHYRRVDGPAIVLRTVEVEDVVRRWRERRAS